MDVACGCSSPQPKRAAGGLRKAPLAAPHNAFSASSSDKNAWPKWRTAESVLVWYWRWARAPAAARLAPASLHPLDARSAAPTSSLSSNETKPLCPESLQATSAWLVLLLGSTAGVAAGWEQGALAAYACLAAASLANHCLAGPSPSAAALKRQQALAVLLRLGWFACQAALAAVPLPW